MNKERMDACFEANRKRDSSTINMSMWSCCLIGGYNDGLRRKVAKAIFSTRHMDAAFPVLAEHFDISVDEAKMLFSNDNSTRNGRDALHQLLTFIEREDARATTVTDDEPTPQVTYDK